MTGAQAIKTALESTQNLMGWYLGDLSDADLLVRPVPGANHVAWQLGHLILADQKLVREALPDVALPELPKGFAERHTKETASADTGFATKGQYLELFNQTRQAIHNAVGKLSDSDLDRPMTGNMAQFAPTVGAHLLLMANHAMMHAGQFTTVRRKLGKPVLF